jgi:outer membrane biosynthesis protein TonB
MKIWISRDGEVNRVEYIGGHPLLAESALKAIKSWRYETGAKDTTTVVEVKF